MLGVVASGGCGGAICTNLRVVSKIDCACPSGAKKNPAMLSTNSAGLAAFRLASMPSAPNEAASWIGLLGKKEPITDNTASAQSESPLQGAVRPPVL
jgi:hypothetical protein